MPPKGVGGDSAAIENEPFISRRSAKKRSSFREPRAFLKLMRCLSYHNRNFSSAVC